MFRTVSGVSLALTVGIVLAVAGLVLNTGGSVPRALGWGAYWAVMARVLPMLGSFIIAYWPRREDRVPALDAAATARLVGREIRATILLFFFYHPFEKLITRHEPERITPGDTPLVLVHGFYANAGFWHPMRKKLEAAGWRNVFTLNLEPPFADIDGYAAQLGERIETACARCGVDAAVVVGHSMGGLVARACARRIPRRFRQLICIGSPHRGTVPASLVPAANTRQMRRGSDWLRELNDAGVSVPAVNIYSAHDNIIVPQANASLDGVENIRLSNLGHLDMAFSSKLSHVLIDVLNRLPAVPST